MYYPYLRARQFELIALRELAEEDAIQKTVLPILEPVNKATKNLSLANEAFVKHGQQAYLILNPSVGDITGDGDHYLDFFTNLPHCAYLPAFHFNNNANFIQTTIAENKLTRCLLVCSSDTNADDVHFKELCELPAIQHIVVHDPDRNRSLKRYIGGLDKHFIRLDDLFEKLPRNSDYLEIPKRRYSEEHHYFQQDGFAGFSDFTILPSEYSTGGSTPRAVVIHLTYLKTESEIWIRHFTSETNDSTADVQGKFGQAAEKAVRFCRTNQLNNSAIRELEGYFDDRHYPGLGMVKKISIKNYLLVISDYLQTQLAQNA